MKTLVGLYENLATAHKIVSDLRDIGVACEDISLIAGDITGEFTHFFETRDRQHNLEDQSTDLNQIEDRVIDDAGSGAAKGAGAGAVLGGVAGLLVGLGLLAIPGIGPVVAAGPLLSALAGIGIGAATGGLVGALVNAGIPQTEAERYAEDVRRGNVLVGVHARDDMIDQVTDVMHRYHPVDVRESIVDEQHVSARGITVDVPDHDDVNGPDDQTRRKEDYTAGDVNVGARSNRADVMRTHPVEHGGARVRTTVDDNVVGAGSAVYGEQGYVERDDVPAGTLPQATAPQGAYAGTPTTERDFDTYESDFREHYERHYGSSDYEYEQIQPAYRYGFDLGTNERNRDEDWDHVEREARRNWERNYPGSAWEDFKAAIREGWDRGRDTSLPGTATNAQPQAGDESYARDNAARERADDDADDNAEIRTTSEDLVATTQTNVLMTGRESAEHEGEQQAKAELALRVGSAAPGMAWDAGRLDLREAEAGRYENEFRAHYERNYIHSEYGYEPYQRAYHYGFGLDESERYRGREWDEIEPNVRAEWEHAHPGHSWEDFKDAVREGWDRVRGRR